MMTRLLVNVGVVVMCGPMVWAMVGATADLVARYQVESYPCVVAAAGHATGVFVPQQCR